MHHKQYFYNKQKLYYTDDMKKKTTASKKSTKSKTPALRYEPTKVSLAIACLAAISILWLAIIGATS
jgi:hypothetical protein